MSSLSDAVMASIIARAVPASEDQKIQTTAVVAFVTDMQKDTVRKEAELVEFLEGKLSSLASDAPQSVVEAYNRLLAKATA